MVAPRAARCRRSTSLQACQLKWVLLGFARPNPVNLRARRPQNVLRVPDVVGCQKTPFVSPLPAVACLLFACWSPCWLKLQGLGVLPHATVLCDIV